jgi:hypothetical protein
MKRKKIRIGWIIGLALAVLVLVPLFLLPSAAEESRRVTLAGGEELFGLVIPTSECTVLIQSDDVCVEVPLSKIEKVDGSPDVSSLFRRQTPPLLRYDTFEKVERNGDVVLHSSFAKANRSSEILEEIRWGVAPHDLGNSLPITVEEGEGEVRRASAALVRPILPGETLRFANRILMPGYVSKDGDLFVYRNRGAYPEKRLVTRMVRLPEGAQIVSAEPEPIHRFDSEGSPVVVWRRLYAQGEDYPFLVTYRLQS